MHKGYFTVHTAWNVCTSLPGYATHDNIFLAICIYVNFGQNGFLFRKTSFLILYIMHLYGHERNVLGIQEASWYKIESVYTSLCWAVKGLWKLGKDITQQQGKTQCKLQRKTTRDTRPSSYLVHRSRVPPFNFHQVRDIQKAGSTTQWWLMLTGNLTGRRWCAFLSLHCEVKEGWLNQLNYRALSNSTKGFQ